MSIGTEVISDEFPGATGVVMVRRDTEDGVVCQVLWTSDAEQTRHVCAECVE